MHTILRGHFDEQVDMIRHHLQFEDLGVALGGGLAKDALQPFFQVSHQNAAPVFGAPDNGVLARINHVVVALVFHSLNYIRMRYLTQGKALAAPQQISLYPHA